MSRTISTEFRSFGVQMTELDVPVALHAKLMYIAQRLRYVSLLRNHSGVYCVVFEKKPEHKILLPATCTLIEFCRAQQTSGENWYVAKVVFEIETTTILREKIFCAYTWVILFDEAGGLCQIKLLPSRCTKAFSVLKRGVEAFLRTCT